MGRTGQSGHWIPANHRDMRCVRQTRHRRPGHAEMVLARSNWEPMQRNPRGVTGRLRAILRTWHWWGGILRDGVPARFVSSPVPLPIQSDFLAVVSPEVANLVHTSLNS
jgi:hypothetical protein